MASRYLTWRAALVAVLWVSFFLPWAGKLSLAAAVYRSLAFLSVVTFSPQALVIVVLGLLLFAFPLAGLVSLLMVKAGLRAWPKILWQLSLVGLILLPLGLALFTGDFWQMAPAWGFWLYGVGLLAACWFGSGSLTRRQAFLPGAILVLMLILEIASLARSSQPSTFALVNGTLIDGTGSPPVPGAVVLVRAGKITAAGPKSAVSLPPGVRQIDVKGDYLLPGFIDAHVHNAYRSDYLEQWARSGVTTVCDMGAPVSLFFSLQRDLLTLDPDRARLVVAGPIMTVPGGYPIAVNNFPSLTVTSPGDAAQKTLFLVGQDAEVIKTAIEPNGLPSLSLEELRAIVQQAHQSGRRVRIHQTTLTALNRAVDAGVDVVDHVEMYVPKNVIQTMVKQNITWVPTLRVIQVFTKSDASQTIQDFRSAGGRIAMGTDAGYYTQLGIGMPMAELNFLGKAGLDPMQVIVAATHNSAYACGVERETGTLEPGKSADVLVVSANPLQNIQAVEHPRMVIHLGKILVGRPGN